MKKNLLIAAGAAAGLVNGIFGGGGGMILLPLMRKWGGAEERAAFATCVAAIYPMCIISAVIYYLQVRPPLEMLLPCLLGGAVGGMISGLTLQRVPVRLLKLIFGALLIYGGARYLL